MTYSVEQIANLPILVLRLHSDFDADTELMDAIHEGDQIMLQMQPPIYYICDATFAPKPTFKSIVEGSNAVVKRPNFKLVQPMIEEVLMIAPNKAIQAVARGLNTEAFGWLKIKVFATYDAALAYLSDKLSESMME